MFSNFSDRREPQRGTSLTMLLTRLQLSLQQRLGLKLVLINLRSFWGSTLTLMLSVMILSGTFGCSAFLSDDKKAKKPYEVPLNQGECFKKIPPRLEQYFDQKLASAQQIHDVFSCVDQAILDFSNLTVGSKDPNSYHVAELRTFFKTYIFKDKEISPELASSIMKLKVTMVGGSIEVITKEELDKIRSFFQLLEEEMIRLYPHWDIFLFKNHKKPGEATAVPPERLQVATTDLKESMNRLLSELNLMDSKYSLDEIYTLLIELEKFLNLNESNPSSTQSFLKWKKNVLFLKKIRTLLVGDVSEMRGPSEVKKIWSLLIDAYDLVLAYHGDIQYRSWTESHQFPVVDQWVTKIFQVLQKGYALRGSRSIPEDQIDAVIDELAQRHLWIADLDPTTAKKTYRQFTARFLSPNPSVSVHSLDYDHVLRLQKDYSSFSLIQKILGQIFQDQIRIPVEKVLRTLRLYDPKKEIQLLSPYSYQDQTHLSMAWKEFLTLVSSREIRHWDDKGRVSMSLGKKEQWSYQELSYMNFLRLPTSMLMEAYSKGTGEDQSSQYRRRLAKPSIEKFLRVEEVRLIFKEFEDFGYELGFFDLRSADTAGRSTREADLFTPQANGDDKVQFVELFDLLSVMWSGGLLGVSELKAVAAQENCVLQGTEDYFEQPYLQMECAKNALHQHFASIFPNLPAFTTYIERLSPPQWNAFYDDLMVVSRVCLTNQIGLETGDQRTMMVILHYIENLFSLYDKNRDGYFNESEVEKAYPRFELFFLNKTGGEHWWYPALGLDTFKFVIFKGRKPEGLQDLLSFRMEDKKPADRQKILKVFATLKGDLSKLSSSCPQSSGQ